MGIDRDLDYVQSGLMGLADIAQKVDDRNRADAEKKRVLSSPVQKFLNQMLSGRMTPKQAAAAYKLVESGQVAPDAFDYDPVTPGVQGPNEIQSYGKGLGVLAPEAPQSSGGLAAPPRTALSPNRIGSQVSAAPGLGDVGGHVWTNQEAQDLYSAVGAFPEMRPGGLTFEQRYELQRMLEDGRNNRNTDNNATRVDMNNDRLAVARERITSQFETARANREAMLQATLMRLRQSDVNNQRTTGTSAANTLLRTLSGIENSIRAAETKIATSLNSLAQDPNAAALLQQAQQEKALLEQQWQRVYQQAESEALGPPKKPTSSTTIKSGPTPEAKKAGAGIQSEDLLKKLRQGG